MTVKLPEWIQAIKDKRFKSSAQVTDRECRLVEALMIAWDSMLDHYRGHGCVLCKDSMRRIAALGGKQ